MGEAYLDWQKKSAGIKLNDVIEEYRYVAAGERVKSGDLLAYVGEDVAPAIDPPFNAIALSSGEGGKKVKIARVYKEVEVTKLIQEDIIPKTWTKVSNTEYTSNGVTLVASSVQSTNNYYPYYACDGNSNTMYQSEGKSNNITRILTWNFDEPRKITKMYVYIEAMNYMTDDYRTITIQGSKGGTTDNDFVDLFSIPIPEAYTYQSEIKLSNTDYYKYYRIKSENKMNYLTVREWYVTEYETTVKEVIQ